VRGNSIDAVKLPDRFVKASPDVTVRYEAGRVSAEGSITIPKADIVVRQLPESAASPSPDVVVRDRVDPVARSPAQQAIGGELALVLGRKVRLRAFGLDTLLEGTLKLSQGGDGEPQGYGVVRLKEGKFGAYGKELTIERGTLGFAGPLDDPAVDVRATREVDWEGRRVKAGLRLTGTALRPESRVFAEPAMSEADALSYLISGRPLQSANANERSSNAGAALALGVQQTSPITESIGSAVTLDELGVQGGTLDETEIVAGKQLGSDLYVRFAYGVFSRIGTVLARYKLGRNVSIEAASGADQSLDLIYSVERD
jgi:translocation and assembly module TamB